MVQIPNIDFRKYQIIHQILALKDEWVISQVENWLAKFLPQSNPLLPSFIKPLQKNLSIDTLKKSQSYTVFDKELFWELCKDFEAEEGEENVEYLLRML